MTSLNERNHIFAYKKQHLHLTPIGTSNLNFIILYSTTFVFCVVSQVTSFLEKKFQQFEVKYVVEKGKSMIGVRNKEKESFFLVLLCAKVCLFDFLHTQKTVSLIHVSMYVCTVCIQSCRQTGHHCISSTKTTHLTTIVVKSSRFCYLFPSDLIYDCVSLYCGKVSFREVCRQQKCLQWRRKNQNRQKGLLLLRKKASNSPKWVWKKISIAYG